MTEFKFEGDFESLSEPQLKLVQNVLQSQGFKDGAVIVESVGQKGDNYVAEIKRFTFKTNDGTFFKMVAKVAPNDENVRKMMNTFVLFTNEIIMYEAVMPKFNEIQNSAGISVSEKVRFPICYGVVSEAPNEFILLEDLNESGFEMLDRFQPLANDTVKLSLKGLAIFHSLSYALKNIEPNTYNNIARKFINMWVMMDQNPATAMFFEGIETQLKQMLESEKQKRVLNGSLSQITVQAKKMNSYETTSKYSVIQQGDCWSNNILYKLEEGNAVENVMIDYQLSRESNPAADILYFILNCTDHATRIKHFHEWIDYYHEALDDSLANFGLKANLIFPKDQLDADLRRYGKMMTGLGLMLSSILVREAKDTLDIKDAVGESPEVMANNVIDKFKNDALDMSTIERLKLKVEGIIDSSLHLGLV